MGKLRLFGNSHVAQATVAVPVLGYFILFNSAIVDYLRIHSDFCSGITCEVSWRLYFLYFGCFFIALGAMSYAVFCPSVVKRYGGASDFFEAERTYFSSPGNLKYLFDRIEIEKGGPANDVFDLKIHIVGKNAALNAAHSHAIADVMAEYYVLKNLRLKYVRVCALLCYSLGVALLSIPTIFTFVQVAVRATEKIAFHIA